MFDHRHYVPVLKAKAGELRALRGLDRSVTDNLTPLLEIPQVPWDFVEDKPSRSLAEHVDRTVANIAASWRSDRPAFLDFYDTESAAVESAAVVRAFTKARDSGLQLIPVTDVSRPPSYQHAIKQVVQQNSGGLCLRVVPNTFQETVNSINSFLQEFGLHPSDVDFVLDFGEISPDHATTYSLAVIGMLTSLPYITQWRTLTVTASAFPEYLSGLPVQAVTPLPRTEWIEWTNLLKRHLPRIPTFGDYAIQHPNVQDIDPRVMQMSANLRYTTTKAWLIARGLNVRHHGYEQFRDLCRMIVDRPEFCGKDYSPGDAFIYQCAHNEGGPGNATTWREVGTSHHLKFVVDQIASLSGI